MLSSLVKEHQAKQAARKEKQGLCELFLFNREKLILLSSSVIPPPPPPKL
jgi:hypothetical protein